jgi:thioredoxin reductase (NADPH)
MERKDLVIIGSGVAGYTAAIYAARSNLKILLYEGFKMGLRGGQLMTTTVVENFPGFEKGVLGPDLMENMRNQSLKFGTKMVSEDVLEVDLSSHPFKIIGSKTKVETNSLIIATGAEAKRLNIPGNEKFWQKGVSTCAICDGAIPLFRDKDLFVIGGGDSAVEEALFLTKFASKVYIVHRRDRLRASTIMMEKVLKSEKVDILWNSELVEILGDEVVGEVVLKNNETGKTEKMKAGGVFFAIGRTPNTGFLKTQVTLDENGYILVKKGTTLTNVEGVFAAGDVQDFVYKQAVVAAGSGCMAALDSEKWLVEKGFID